MYVFRILEKMLSQEIGQNKEIEISKQKEKTFKNTASPKKNSSHSAYCLFANSGESFLASQKPNKFNIFLSNISHPNKRNPAYKEANDFINNKIKGKTIYYNIVSTKENGDIVADVYLDPEKTICLNILLEENGLDHSEDIQKNENLSSFEKIDSFTDMQIISSEPAKEVKKNDPNKNVGFIIDFGWAPFLNKEENSKSFYITIDENGSKITKWGLDLKNAIKNSEVIKGDHIELIKKPASANSKKNTWLINKLNLTTEITNTEKKEVLPISDLQHSTSISDDRTHSIETQILKNNLIPSSEISWDDSFNNQYVPEYEPMDLDDLINENLSYMLEQESLEKVLQTDKTSDSQDISDNMNRLQQSQNEMMDLDNLIQENSSYILEKGNSNQVVIPNQKEPLPSQPIDAMDDIFSFFDDTPEAKIKKKF